MSGVFCEVMIPLTVVVDNFFLLNIFWRGLCRGGNLDTVIIMRRATFYFIPTTTLRGEYHLHVADEESERTRG